MKKLLSIVLVLALAVCAVSGLASCKKKVDIYDVVAASRPTSATTYTTYKSAEAGDFLGEYTLRVNGDDFIFEYAYERLRTIDEAVADGTTEMRKAIDGALCLKGGKSTTVGDAFDSALPALNVTSFALSEGNLKNAYVSDDGLVLTASVTAANSEKVFGVKISAEGDISLRVETDGTYARRVSVSYTTTGGASVTIETSYSYSPVTLDFPEGM